jgi:hypothetical protein
MNEDLTLDLAIAPDGAIDRISASINKRGRRAFGVLKTANEYVGVVREHEFELWERQQRAVHARGRVVPRHRGCRLEVSLIVPRRTRFLVGLFFALYALASVGIATQPPDPTITAGEVLVSLLGAVVLVALFAAGARSQRADLQRFFERVFEDVARI